VGGQESYDPGWVSDNLSRVARAQWESDDEHDQNGYMVPTVATVNGVDTVVRYNSAQVILNIHPESTLQDRKDLNAYVANSLDNALIKTTVENLEPAY